MGSRDESGTRRPRRKPPRERPERRPSVFAVRYEESKARHGEPGWYEWCLREFARYWYVLGVLAVALFVPLQIEYSLMPLNGPPLQGPLVTALAMVGAAAATIAAGAYGYGRLWGAEGWVDGAIARYEAEHEESEVPPGE